MLSAKCIRIKKAEAKLDMAADPKALSQIPYSLNFSQNTDISDQLLTRSLDFFANKLSVRALLLPGPRPLYSHSVPLHRCSGSL